MRIRWPKHPSRALLLRLVPERVIPSLRACRAAVVRGGRRRWALAGLAVLAGLLAWRLAVPGVPAVAVEVDGQVIGLVADRAAAEQALAAAGGAGEGGRFSYRESVNLRETRGAPEAILEPGAVAEQLRRRLTFLFQGVAIEVNGSAVATLASEEDASKALQLFRERYLPQGAGVTVAASGFEERVQTTPAQVPPDRLLAPEQVAELLARGRLTNATYVVREGDSLWTIARASGLTVEQLRSANPGLQTDVLQIGQELNLVKPEPLLHFRVAYQEKVQERIPAPVQYRTDPQLWRGQERVQQQGRAGSKEVLYAVSSVNGRVEKREKLSETVVEKPSPRVVVRGSKVMVASRGGGGSGALGWPLRGSITSPYGQRGKEFHTGLDINGDTGDPVFAAESGRVIFAGWNGNYGRLLAIDHGDGLVTRYAHLAAFRVGVGDTVERGDLVGLVGQSGRATGSHLHFEVLVNGAFRNPLNYLR